MPKPRPCPDQCHVLLVGTGGREHALAWKLKQSPRLARLWVTEGANAGLAALGSICPVAMDGRDPFRMSRWCDANNIDLVVVGPEVALAQGITDILQIGS